MQNRRPLVWQALAIAVMCVFIPISIKYFDRPVATFFAVHFVDIQGLGRFAALPGWLLLPALLIPFVTLASPRLLGRQFVQAALLFSISVVWTSAIVEIVLKRFFGRLGTDAWLAQGAYGFHLMAGANPQFRSFPSGEAAILSATICSLWPIYPRLRPVFALLAIAEIFLLLSLNWHFLSDVIAGGLTGAIGSLAAKRLLEQPSASFRHS